MSYKPSKKYNKRLPVYTAQWQEMLNNSPELMPPDGVPVLPPFNDEDIEPAKGRKRKGTFGLCRCSRSGLTRHPGASSANAAGKKKRGKKNGN
jgi:hypothetical protein